VSEAVVSTQAVTPETVLSQFANAVCTRKQVQISPSEMKDEVLNVCINLRMKVDQLPTVLQEFHQEARQRIERGDCYVFNLDGVRRSVAAAIADTARYPGDHH
jgi:hypothetical protein